MKAELKLQLDLDVCEDKELFQAISTDEHRKWKSVVWELNQHLRGLVKYCDDSYHEEYIKCADEIRSKIFELVNEENLTLD